MFGSRERVKTIANFLGIDDNCLITFYMCQSRMCICFFLNNNFIGLLLRSPRLVSVSVVLDKDAPAATETHWVMQYGQFINQ